MTEYDKLIYGKSQIEFITSIEVQDDKALLFRELPDGTVDTLEVSNRFWALAPYNMGGYSRLKGDLHYKFGKQFSTEEEFLKYRKENYKRDIFTIRNSKESLMVKDGYTYFKGMKPTDISVLSFDIEGLGLNLDENSGVPLISNTFRRNGVITRKLFCYDEYDNMGDMIEDWCNWVREVNPSVLTGHNVFGYDLPYLEHVASMYKKSLKLGRDGSPMQIQEYESKFRIDGAKDLHYHKCHIFGREIVDTMFLAYKYDVGRKYESYGLKKIIEQEGLTKENRVFYDASKIRHNYKIKEEWEKIKVYCEDDSDDALALYDLMVPPFFYMTQTVAKPFQMIFESASGSQINTVMMRSYLQDGHSLPKASEAEEYEGAISIGNPGIYRNVFKGDVASLYPSIMIQYDVYDEAKDPNQYFSKLVKTFTERRLHHKALAKTDKYHDDMQAAFKIFINSCYGFLGTPGLLFNSPANAAFVTRKGREILTMAIEWSEQNEYTLVNCDTDSVSICRKDHSFIPEEERVTILDRINALFPEKIKWEDDGYYLTFVVVKAKNYILWDGKKLKYKGSAIKATQKEPALKEYIKKIIDVILNETDNDQLYSRCQKVYNNYVTEIMNVLDIKRWVHKKTITDKVLKNTRTNEAKVRDAIEGTEYVEGDKIFLYFKEDGNLSLVERYNKDHDKAKLLEKLYKTTLTFETILPIKELFKNYSLVRNFKLLQTQEEVNE
jgi:DNA polymerase I